MSKDYRGIELAMKLAKKNQNSSMFFFGGVLMRGNRIISIGFNQPYKTHTKSNNRWNTIHCELDTILGVSEKDLHDSSLYIARLGYGKTIPVFAKPCINCQEIITSAKIGRVFFTINQNSFGRWLVKRDQWDIFSF